MELAYPDAILVWYVTRQASAQCAWLGASDAEGARSCVSLFSLPGGDSSRPKMTVYDAIVLRLSEKRGGNTLPAKAIKTTAKYLSENVGLEDAHHELALHALESCPFCAGGARYRCNHREHKCSSQLTSTSSAKFEVVCLPKPKPCAGRRERAPPLYGSSSTRPYSCTYLRQLS